MPKGIPNKKYTSEFKQSVVEHMHKNKLSYCETAGIYEVSNHYIIQSWERIYLEEGAQGFKIERRGRGSKGHPGHLPKQVEEDLLAEFSWLEFGVRGANIEN